VSVTQRGAAADAGARDLNPWRPDFLAGGGALHWLAANLVVAALYCALGYAVSRFFAAYGLFPAPIWLPASIAVVAAMMGGLRLAPGIFLGSFIVNFLLFNPPFHVAAVISLTNALGPVAGAAVLRRFRPATGLFTRFAGVVAFLLCAVLLHPALTATGGTLAVSLEGPTDLRTLYSTWVSWWLSDSGGTLYLAPALLLWLGAERMPAKQQAVFNRRDLAVCVSVAAIALVLFATPPMHGSDVRLVFPFLLVVPLSWIALRRSLRAAYTLIFLVSVVACAATVAGYGPFQIAGIANPLQLVGGLVVLLAMDVLTIVALVCERREAQEANRVKSMFLANMSHELRTPLNAVIGFSEVIHSELYGPIANERYAEFVGHILNSGRHLLALINDVLDMSKIESGRFELNEAHLSIRAVVEEAAGLMQFQASSKGVSLAANVARAEVTVRADPKALRQILLNLLSNAIKFTPEGGWIAIEAERGGNGELLVHVADSGVGIPEDALERVFAPFEQGSVTLARKVEGTGLGLSITRGLVALHGGTISLRSEVGRGTVVTVLLPPNRIVASGADAYTA
jgi:two-component system cell cycle sensor histidine kinase PleC